MKKKMYKNILLVTSFLLVSFSFFSNISIAEIGDPIPGGLDVDCVINSDCYYAEEIEFVGTASGGESPYNFKWTLPGEDSFWHNGTSGTSIQDGRYYYPTTSPKTYSLGLYAKDKNGKNAGLYRFLTIEILYDIYWTELVSQSPYYGTSDDIGLKFKMRNHGDYYTCPYFIADFELQKYNGLWWVSTSHNITNYEYDIDLPQGEDTGSVEVDYENNPGVGIYRWKAIITEAPYDNGEHGPHIITSPAFRIGYL
jgi:hypothetical protein